MRNSSAFGSAPRREAASQPISQLARPTVSQTGRNTQFGFFVSDRCGPKQWGELLAQGKQWPNGNAADHRLFGRRFKPRLSEHGGSGADDSRLTRIRTADLKLCSRLCRWRAVPHEDRCSPKGAVPNAPAPRLQGAPPKGLPACFLGQAPHD